MAVFVFTNAYVIINGFDFAGYGTNVQLDFKADDVDSTVFNSGANRSHMIGLKGGTFAFECNQNFQQFSVDRTFWDIWDGRLSVACAVRSVTGAISNDNPEYQFNAVLPDYTPLGHSVGELAKARANFVITGAITRDETP